MSDTISIRVNGEIPGYAKGSVVAVRCDSEGTPLEQLWRRRLKDAERDGCCEVVEPEPRAEPQAEEKVVGVNLFEPSTDEDRPRRRGRRRESKS